VNGAAFAAPAEAAAIEAALRAGSTPERAASEAAYLKSDPRRFLGATVPVIRQAVGAWARANRGLGRDDLLALVEALWASDLHEPRTSAILLLERYEKRLEPADMAVIERYLRGSGTWALVDGLAEKVAGALAARSPEAFAVSERWATDPDFWLRRSSLLALLGPLRAGGGDWDAFVRRAVPLLPEREFFIRKAIGWVLREVSKKRPALVRGFLEAHGEAASGLTRREASKYLERTGVAPTGNG
jgi:3-methyladenine DNA glycosylase AlkD